MSTAKLQIGIVIGSTRQARFGEKPAQWIHSVANAKEEATFELLDLRNYELPFFDEPMSPAMAPSENKVAKVWAAALARQDGLVIVTPEYNHAPPAVLKNALDYAYPEFNRKPVAFVGYGGVGAARAIEQLRLIAVELQMAPIRHSVHLGLNEYLGIAREGKAFSEYPHLEQTAEAMLNELLWWAGTLSVARRAT